VTVTIPQYWFNKTKQHTLPTTILSPLISELHKAHSLHLTLDDSDESRGKSFFLILFFKNILYRDSFVSPRKNPLGTNALSPSPRGGPASLRCNALFEVGLGLRWLRFCIDGCTWLAGTCDCPRARLSTQKSRSTSKKDTHHEFSNFNKNSQSYDP